MFWEGQKLKTQAGHVQWGGGPGTFNSLQKCVLVVGVERGAPSHK